MIIFLFPIFISDYLQIICKCMHDFVNWYWAVKDVKLICTNKVPVVLIDINFYINETETRMYVTIPNLFDFEILNKYQMWPSLIFKIFYWSYRYMYTCFTIWSCQGPMYYEVINTKTPQDIMWTVLKANVNFNLKDEVSYLCKMSKYFSQNCFRVASMYL